MTSLRRRYLVLLALRWFPVGLLIPVIVLLILERGLSLTELGIVFAVQGLLVLVLELPTGGLADAMGRRRVLLVAGAFNLASVALLFVADSFVPFAAAFALQGVYRALESGPLDAWFVDSAQALDPEADIETALARGGAVLAAALGVGSLASSGVVALDFGTRAEVLSAPVAIVFVLRMVELAAIVTLMTDAEGTRRANHLWVQIRSVPQTVGSAIKTVARSRVLVSLIAIELFWGFGVTAFEVLTPARLDELVSSAERAATLLGPANTAAWLAAAFGAALVPWLTRRLRPAATGALLRVGHGLTVLGIAVATGPLGLVVAYVLTMGIHGASNPVHQGLLHRGVGDSTTRATVVSANSLAAHAGGMIGGIALGATAAAAGLTTAVGAGAAALAVVAPLYLLTGRDRAAPSDT